MKVTLLLSTSGLDESAGTPESVELLLVGVFGEASNCSDETAAPIADRAGFGQSFETVADPGAGTESSNPLPSSRELRANHTCVYYGYSSPRPPSLLLDLSQCRPGGRFALA